MPCWAPYILCVLKVNSPIGVWEGKASTRATPSLPGATFVPTPRGSP